MADKSLAKRTSSTPSAAAGGSSTPSASTTPFQWRNIAIIVGVLGVAWLTALATGSKIFLVVVGVITVTVLGLLGYVYRWYTKQRDMMELLKTANLSPQARKEALAKLQSASGADKDVMNLVARAQLEAQEDPEKALTTLESIDMKKAPAMIADDVRAFRAQLYLMLGRPSEARPLADEINVKNAQQPEARGMMAATVAQTWARTGKHKEALELLQTIKPDDAEYGQARMPLLMARVYACFAGGQLENVKRDLGALVRQDPNLLAVFVNPKGKAPPQLQKIAKDVLQRSPEARKLAMQNAPRSQRRMR